MGSIVLLPGRKPNCWLQAQIGLVWLMINLAKILSKTLHNEDVIAIGLWSSGVGPFGIGVICADFHCVGVKLYIG